MRKVLITSPQFYPAYKNGGPVQSLKALSGKLNSVCELSVLTSFYDLDGTPLDVEPDRFNETKYGNVFYSTNLSYRKVKEIVQAINPDFIYVNSFFSTISIKIFWLTRFSRNVKVVIAPRGELMVKPLANKALKKNIYMFFFNLFLYNKKMIWHLATRGEQDDLLQVIKTNNSCVISNLKEIKQSAFAASEKVDGSLKVVTLSRVNQHKNIDYLIEVLSQIKNGKCICDVYGAIEDKDYYAKCMDLVNHLPNHITVSFKGEIKPENVVQTLSGYDLFFSPTKSENFGHAIFEAVEAGLPILISDKVPFFADVEQHNAGWTFPLTDQHKFVACVQELLEKDYSYFDNLKTQTLSYFESKTELVSDISPYKKLFDIE